MASSSGSGSAMVDGLKSRLYDICAESTPGTVFKQEDLMDLQIIPDNNASLLLQVTQKLCDEKLFKTVRDGTNIGWMYRSVEDAKKYKGLSYEQEMVYALIDDAGTEGMWSKTIKTRSGLHDTTMRSVIKALETKRLINDMKSVLHPTRKMYIKSSLQPNESATGGPWFTDGELDEEFITQVGHALYQYIFAKSFYQSSIRGLGKKSRKVSSSKGSGDVKRIKVEAEGDEQAQKRQKLESLLPLPPGYQGYPTLNELTRFVDNMKLTETTLSQDDIQQLLDVLILDRRIEKVVSGSEGVAFKALRKTLQEIEDGRSNGLTESPCGRCPVFNLCEEGGPVGPSNCEYFRDWLAQ
ncbi:MAG: 34-kDa subunit of RNA polymerase III (C) [Claussenomyces sp. TS43310]|nr:MAG: 34-kDa subunit of RNA polymerase III (C) [Claussenomyces sp. TS43310]